jgi:hypothetical protein
MSGFFNLIKHGPKIAKTVTSPITHAKNVITSAFKPKKTKIGGQEKSKRIKEAVAIKKGATKIDDKITKQYTEAKAKVKKGVLDRKDIVGGAKNKRDSKRLMKKADEFVKETLKGFKRGGRAGFNKGSKDPVGKKKSKFPDFSGDGEVTQKDVLMAKGVIPKPKNKKKVI